jgi:hypothetical protein
MVEGQGVEEQAFESSKRALAKLNSVIVYKGGQPRPYMTIKV